MNSIHEASPLQSLPVELQVAICSHLKDIDLAIMELTCKHFKELLKDDLFWKEKTPLSAEAYPDLSAKARLLKNYRDYCNYFSEIFPELKEGPSLNAFQKKKQTDEVLKKSFEERSINESGMLFLEIFCDKKELIHLVVDVFVGLALPSDQKSKLEPLNFEIMNASMMHAPDTFISLVKKLNINFRKLPLEIQHRFLHYAIGNVNELVPFLIEEGIKPNDICLRAAVWSPKLIPMLTEAMNR